MGCQFFKGRHLQSAHQSCVNIDRGKQEMRGQDRRGGNREERGESKRRSDRARDGKDEASVRGSVHTK